MGAAAGATETGPGSQGPGKRSYFFLIKGEINVLYLGFVFQRWWKVPERDRDREPVETNSFLARPLFCVVAKIRRLWFSYHHNGHGAFGSVHFEVFSSVLLFIWHNK